VRLYSKGGREYSGKLPGIRRVADELGNSQRRTVPD
jgi:hypothetical protein